MTAQKKTLSIIIPAYNEEKTIQEILKAVIEVQLEFEIDKELVVIDDYSGDKTADKVNEFIEAHPDINISFYQHKFNQGKGAALHTGIKEAKGDYLVIQDADLEYDPEEYNLLLKPLEKGSADVVYGSRFMGGNPHRILFFWHSIGNKFLTFLSNMFTNLNLTDLETC